MKRRANNRHWHVVRQSKGDKETLSVLGKKGHAARYGTNDDTDNTPADPIEGTPKRQRTTKDQVQETPPSQLQLILANNRERDRTTKRGLAANAEAKASYDYKSIGPPAKRQLFLQDKAATFPQQKLPQILQQESSSAQQSSSKDTMSEKEPVKDANGDVSMTTSSTTTSKTSSSTTGDETGGGRTNAGGFSGTSMIQGAIRDNPKKTLRRRYTHLCYMHNNHEFQGLTSVATDAGFYIKGQIEVGYQIFRTDWCHVPNNSMANFLTVTDFTDMLKDGMYAYRVVGSNVNLSALQFSHSYVPTTGGNQFDDEQVHLQVYETDSTQVPRCPNSQLNGLTPNSYYPTGNGRFVFSDATEANKCGLVAPVAGTITNNELLQYRWAFPNGCNKNNWQLWYPDLQRYGPIEMLSSGASKDFTWINQNGQYNRIHRGLRKGNLDTLENPTISDDTPIPQNIQERLSRLPMHNWNSREHVQNPKGNYSHQDEMQSVSGYGNEIPTVLLKIPYSPGPTGARMDWARFYLTYEIEVEYLCITPQRPLPIEHNYMGVINSTADVNHIGRWHSFPDNRESAYIVQYINDPVLEGIQTN